MNRPRGLRHPQFHFDIVAGRYVVLCFFGSAAEPASRRILDDVLQQRSVFDDENVCFFGMRIDPDDERSGRVREMLPGIHLFWDFDRTISRLYGAAVQTGDDSEAESDRRFSVVLDERLRVVTFFCPFFKTTRPSEFTHKIGVSWVLHRSHRSHGWQSTVHIIRFDARLDA